MAAVLRAVQPLPIVPVVHLTKSSMMESVRQDARTGPLRLQMEIMYVRTVLRTVKHVPGELEIVHPVVGRSTCIIRSV